MQTRVSVIGAGRMGSALVRALMQADYDTMVWNRTATKCKPLAEIGAHVASSVAEAVEGAEIIVINVDRYPTSDSLFRSEAIIRALRGRTLVQMTSGSPAQARESAAWADRQGIEYLDAAILATPDLIGREDTTILYAGRNGLFERHRHVFLAFGGNPYLVGGDVGHASTLDSAMLSYMWGTFFAVLVGASLCAAEGVPLATYRGFTGALASTLGEWAVDLLERVETRRFGGETSASDISTHHDAFAHLTELAGTHGIDPAIHAGFERVFQAALEAGRGGEDFAALYDFLRAKAG